jgi:tRNA (guanine-N1)-methyltransferase
VVIDAIARLLPGTLGSAESALQESFSDGLVDWPHYTRPPAVDGHEVPAVLASGDHRRFIAGGCSRRSGEPGCAGRSCSSGAA